MISLIGNLDQPLAKETNLQEVRSRATWVGLGSAKAFGGSAI